MELDTVAEEYVLGRLRIEELAREATRLLVAGAETDEMAVAAMPDTTDPREIRQLFEIALTSTGTSLPAWDRAVTSWLQRQARAVTAREVTLEEVAERVRETCGWLAEVEQLPSEHQHVVFLADNEEDALRSWWVDAFRDALVAVSGE